MVCLCRRTQHHKVIHKPGLGYRLRPATTHRLVLSAAADIMRPTETAMLGPGNKLAKWEEMADFENKKKCMAILLMVQ